VQGEILLRVHDATTLVREERVLRGLRYQAALAEPEPRRAARLLVAIGREDPSFVPAWVSAGDLFERAGRRFTARRVWERGARRRPVVVLLERLERLNASEGKPERTTRLYRRLRRRHPESAAVALLFRAPPDRAGPARRGRGGAQRAPRGRRGPPAGARLWAEVHRQRGNSSLAAESYARVFGADLGLVAPFRCTALPARGRDLERANCEECKRWGTLEAEAERAP